MKLDLSHQPKYWGNKKFNKKNTTYMPAIMGGLLLLGVLIAFMA